MECANCELKQRQFYCENCLKQHLLSYRLQIGHATSERDEKVSSANRALLTVVEPPRLRRADLRSVEERVREIWDALEHVRKANEAKRERIQVIRDVLTARRRTLAAATSPDLPSCTSSTSSSPSPGAAFSGSPPTRPFLAHPNKHASTPGSASSSRPPSSSATGPSAATARLTQIARSASASAAPSTPKVGSPPGAWPSSPTLTPANPRDRSNERDRDSTEMTLVRQIEEAQHQLNQLAQTIARARAGLVLELVEVFSVVEVGGRPPLGGKAGTRGEWTIGGLVLPVPGDMRRYPPDHINAVITHTLHFLFLLAFYLGVKLPFEVVWSRSSTPPSPNSSSSASNPPIYPSSPQAKWREAERPNGLLGVGTPWIGAVRGSESGGWARWSTKHPLHVSARESGARIGSTADTMNAETSPGSTSRHGRTASSPLVHRVSSHSAAPPPSMDDSQLDDMPQGEVQSMMSGTGTNATTTSAFTTALAMLLYDVCYLAHTQGVDVPLAQAGEVLGNLWAVCCSTDLGRKSHATHTQPRLPAPTPPTFPLEFAQLLQATAANPSRARARGGPGREVTRRHRERERDRIAEEDEWDLIEDV